MREPVQEELPLWPLQRWPTRAYLSEALGVYFAVSSLGGFLFFLGAMAFARPLWAVIFAAGALAGVIGFRWFRKVLRPLNRILQIFPYLA